MRLTSKQELQGHSENISLYPSLLYAIYLKLINLLNSLTFMQSCATITPNLFEEFFIRVCRGYMVPEYAMQGQLSLKVDVYSFGVLILEIVTGIKNSDINFSPEMQSLSEWVRLQFMTFFGYE